MKTKASLAIASALLAASLFVGSTADAGTCRSHWNESEANDYCSASIGTVLAGTGVGNCVLTITCSISVSLDGTSTLYTPSETTTETHDDTEDLDICFYPDTQGTHKVQTFAASIETGCGSNGTTSDDAVSDGLSTQEEEDS